MPDNTVENDLEEIRKLLKSGGYITIPPEHTEGVIAEQKARNAENFAALDEIQRMLDDARAKLDERRRNLGDDARAELDERMRRARKG